LALKCSFLTLVQAMTKTFKYLIDEQIRSNRKWLSECRDVYERGLEFLNEELEERSLEGLLCAADSLSDLATYYGTEGTIAQIDGHVDACQTIHKAATCWYWAVKIRSQIFTISGLQRAIRERPNLTNFASLSACLLAYSRVHQIWGWQTLTLNCLLGIATWPDAINEAYWDERIFEPFILRLYQRETGIDLADDITNRDIGVYGDVLESWNDPKRLEAALVAICDYHCRNMNDTGGGWDAEFKHPPFDLMPSEIYFVYAVRNRMGLETPRVDHPLMALPFMSMKLVDVTVDRVVERVERAYYELFDEPGSM